MGNEGDWINLTIYCDVIFKAKTCELFLIKYKTPSCLWASFQCSSKTFKNFSRKAQATQATITISSVSVNTYRFHATKDFSL